MKSSAILAAVAGAMLGAASPIKVEERIVKVVTDIEWVTETVTDEVVATATATVFQGPGKHKSFPPKVATTSTTPVAAAVVTPTTSVVVVVETQAAPSSSVQAPDANAAAAAASTAKSAASTTSSSTLASGTDFISTALYNHNIHRINNSAPAVSWSDTYAASAAILAATCHYGHNMTINGGGYGQNIAMWATSGDAKSLGATNAIAMASSPMWYNGEVNSYPSDGYGQASPNMDNFEAWGHYSQMVWVETTQIGCAAQYCEPGTMESGMGSWYMVCNYYPPGNMGGAYGKNVLRPAGEATYNPPNMP